jgi:hypothetical protein
MGVGEVRGQGELGAGKSDAGKKIIESERWTRSYASVKGDGEVLGYAIDCTMSLRLGILFSLLSLLLALVLSRYEMYLLHDFFPPLGRVRDGGGHFTCFPSCRWEVDRCTGSLYSPSASALRIGFDVSY